MNLDKSNFEKIEYDYYIYLDGERVQADECSSWFGDITCEVNGVFYKNLPVELVEVKRTLNEPLYNFYNFVLSYIVIFLMVITGIFFLCNLIRV